MARIQNKGNGKWTVVINGGYTPDGKQVRYTKTINVVPDKGIDAQEQIVMRKAAAIEHEYHRQLFAQA